MDNFKLQKLAVEPRDLGTPAYLSIRPKTQAEEGKTSEDE